MTPADVLCEATAGCDADEIVIGAHGSEPDTTRDVGATTREGLAAADRPVVVVPIPDLYRSARRVPRGVTPRRFTARGS
ncbi:UspA domain-containing protein [Natrinema limicola JCM 13563]|uniref:UspA domain-containing protein n=1 Tax=Natrinema limicola JCM 13563 TaxID=1230457 RepID=M0CDE7_9EURY|nr:UspA domain-containing protein [Natrinema limicola]ELZ21275.1 UspA domain-containing protein [Natrinema limicola JCM 13563]